MSSFCLSASLLTGFSLILKALINFWQAYNFFAKIIKKINELEEEKAKKKKAEKTDLMKEVARLPKKDDKKNKTEVKGRSWDNK